MKSILLVAASTAAAVIHFALGPEHLEELGPIGLGFYVAGFLQLGWAVTAALLWRDRGGRRTAAGRRLAGIGIGLNGAIMAAWLVSRTIGLPGGDPPWTPEAIGVSDAITAILEIGLVVALVTGMWRATAAPPRAAAAGILPRPREIHSIVGAAPILALILVATVAAISAPNERAHVADADGRGAHPAEMGTTHSR